MNLDIGTAGGQTGKVYVGDPTAGFQNVHLIMANAANITVYKDSNLYLRGQDNDAWIMNNAQAGGYLKVSGTLSRTGAAEGRVQLPILVTSTGSIFVIPSLGNNTALNVEATGLAATQNATLYVQNGGVVQLGPNGVADWNLTAGLMVSSNAVFDGGKLYVLGAVAYFDANTVTFTGGSTVFLSPNSAGNNFTNLVFTLQGSNAYVNIDSARWVFDVKAGQQGNDSVTITGGDLYIQQLAGTTLDVTMNGNSAVGENYQLFAVFGAIYGDFSTTSYTGANFNTTITGGSPTTYVLTTK
jgi:hypothetical protein